MVFLPGHHTLNTNITVPNVSNLTMRSESSSGNRTTVVCNGAVGLSFTNMVGLKIYSLTFTSCSQKYIGTILGIPQNVLHVALLLQYAQYAELVNCSFISNNSTALAVTNSNVTIVGNNFIQNRASEHASYGIGAIFAYINAVLNFSGTNNFINNSAHYGGTIVAYNKTVLRFNGTSNFINNSAAHYGGAISAYNNTVLRFNGTSNFIKNTAYYGGGAIFTYNNTVLNFSGISNFTDSTASIGGTIYAGSNSTLTFNGTIYFTNNGGKVDTQDGHTYGGGVFGGIKCTFSIFPNTTLYWENNHATLGGAIYVHDIIPVSYCWTRTLYVPKEECFFQLPGQNLSNGIDVRLVFKNNSVDVAGSVLYGGAIDKCRLIGLESYSSGKVFNTLVHVEDDNTTSSISSLPLRICSCVNNSVSPCM